jgi:hypothetical protein
MRHPQRTTSNYSHNHNPYIESDKFISTMTRDSFHESRLFWARSIAAMMLFVTLTTTSFPRSCEAFATNKMTPLEATRNVHRSCISKPPSSTRSTARQMVHTIRDADMMEMMVGGQRFEMVPLPDSMMDTTVFVGNLCEFAHDEDLSKVFQSVSRLQSVPACVVRRPNMASMEYAFVTFPSVEEKEVRNGCHLSRLGVDLSFSFQNVIFLKLHSTPQAAILRFHGREFMGRKLRVEEIRDDPRKGRVRVPEHMVSYVLGSAKQVSKKTKRKNNSIAGGMRRVSRLQKQSSTTNNKHSIPKQESQAMAGLPPLPVEMTKCTRKHEPSASAMFVCLKLPDQEEMDRAVRRGFVSLEGIGYGTTRSKSRLATAHRQWCDELEKPQIVHCKATRDNQLDRVIVDLSPLRVSSAIMGAGYEVDEFLVHWKAQIATAASESGMELLKRDNLQDSHCERLSTLDDGEGFMEESGCDPDDIECNELFEDCGTFQCTTEYIVELNEDDPHSTKQPLSKLPILTMGVFEGDRSNAKAMAKQLALLWELPQTADFIETSKSLASESSSSTSISRGSRPKRDRKKEHRRRRRNVQGGLDCLFR